MHQIVLFSGFLRAPNRAFFELSSCTKSCFFVVFFVHQIVFFCGFLRAPNGAPVHAFLFDDFASYTKSCSSSSFFVVFFVHQIVFFFLVFFVHQVVLFLVFFVHQIVLFLCFIRAPNRAFFYFSSCTKSCFFLVFFVHQIVLFCGFLRAPNGALLRATVTEVRQDTIYLHICLIHWFMCFSQGGLGMTVLLQPSCI